MAWLFFTDESGHDHNSMPYEVHGGIAIHVSRLWPFVQDMQRLEVESFGCRLYPFGKEIKGSKLVGTQHFKFARQGALLPDADRKRLCHSFLRKARTSARQRRTEFTAYGQACLQMARGTIGLLKRHGAVLLASAILRGVRKPADYAFDDYLRKDIVFLLERYFYFLEQKQEHGVLVMDETEKHQDQRLVARLEKYFTSTDTGRQRSRWIVPTPFFVSSDMTYAVQAADVCIYCTNWGFRIPSRGMNAETRNEIATTFGPDLAELQFRGQGCRDGRIFDTYGIVYVPAPYMARTGQEERGNAPPAVSARQGAKPHTKPSL